MRSSQHNSIPNRPSTGTPAPWTSRLSVLARTPVKRNEQGGEPDPIQPSFPKLFEMNKPTAYRHKLLLSPTASRKCTVLDLPSNVLGSRDTDESSYCADKWFLCVVNWDGTSRSRSNAVQQGVSAGFFMCNPKTRAVIYWPDISSKSALVTSLASSDEVEVTFPHSDVKTTPSKHRQHIKIGGSATVSSSFNSLIALVTPKNRLICVALACCANGELWQFQCSPSDIQRKKVHGKILGSDRDSSMCLIFGLMKLLELIVSWVSRRIWLVKNIWPLDMQMDDHGKVITVLVATFCKDRVSISSYIQYSLLTLQYKLNVSSSESLERVLEKKSPIQVIIPKARAEEEDF
ncbi:LOW QUALITY PROTEIN: Nucleoporin, Nup133/Nup155-like, N-terminal [Dillenia turbinata]|uniref:Nucleoporin, Nup133/Nup155-like, N-terminal n=1 Tax=Dillenia turbinata TaxID=194707 RepID=A0AAN8UPE7_9MAGN